MNRDLERAAQAFNAGAWEEAKARCRRGLSINQRDPDALHLLGHMLAASGEADEAEAVLAKAWAGAPPDPAFLTNVGVAYSLINLEAQARRAFEIALQIDPEFPRALCGLGDVHFRHGDWDEARRLFERALVRRPDFPHAIASLSDLALRENKDEEARELAQRAAVLAPDLQAPRLALAELALTSGAAEQALEAAECVLAAWQANQQQRGHALDIKGRALERMSRYDEAFVAFTKSNENAKTSSARFDAQAHPLSAQRLETLIEWMRREPSASWPEPPTEAAPAPIFLLGFARSGTTLMGQVLGAHPDVETMEESDRFVDAASVLLTGDPIASWNRLTSDDVAKLRSAYWARVHQILGRAPLQPVVLDKMPMNVIVLPIIHLLFPRAKIIFALRDPRDVVMSCFKQRFALNYATANFLTLEDSVVYYDAVMRLANEARRRLPLNIHELRYEHLVADFDATISATLAFMGLPWRDSVRAFADTAKATRIRTPSARAVAQPISQASSNAWRRYEARLAPFFPTLNKWVAAFGYQVASLLAPFFPTLDNWVAAFGYQVA